MKFKADSVRKLTDDEGNVSVTFTVSGHQKYIADMAVAECKEFGEISVEAKKYRKNRSLEQNGMLWSLISKLSMAISGSKSKTAVEEIYCAILEEANVESGFMFALPETEEGLRKAFRVIRQRAVRDYNGKQMNVYQYWLGSSKYDTAEMTLLIETLLDKCAEFGIYDTEIEMIRGEIR